MRSTPLRKPTISPGVSEAIVDQKQFWGGYRQQVFVKKPTVLVIGENQGA